MARAMQAPDVDFPGFEEARRKMPWIQKYLDINEQTIKILGVQLAQADEFEKQNILPDLVTLSGRHQKQFVKNTRLSIDVIVKIEGFRELALDDQLMLTQTNMTGLGCLMEGMGFDKKSKTTNIGGMGVKEQLVVSMLVPDTNVLFEETRRVAELLHDLQLDPVENGILWSLVSLQTPGQDLIQQAALEGMYERITSHLDDYSIAKTCGIERALQIIMTLPEIRAAAEVKRQYTQEIFRNRPQLGTEPLFRDTFLASILRDVEPRS